MLSVDNVVLMAAVIVLAACFCYTMFIEKGPEDFLREMEQTEASCEQELEKAVQSGDVQKQEYWKRELDIVQASIAAHHMRYGQKM